MFKASIEQLYWQDIRESVAKLNKPLAMIIDKINPGKKHTVYKVQYPYGSEILKNGILQLPNHSGDLVLFNSSDIKKSIQDDLSYNYGSNPVSLILNNTVELFVKFGSRIIPVFNLIGPGKIFGLWYILKDELNSLASFDNNVSNSAIWSMTAGARILFMLPKISKSIAHYKLLQKLNIQTSTPNHLLDHWHIFREIEQKVQTSKPWHLDIIYFSKPWFDSFNQPKWMEFHNFLLRTGWNSSEFWRQKFIWDMVFATIQERSNLKPDPHITNTVEHLFAMGIGAVPGFAPAIDDAAGPIEKVQTVYRDIYNLEYDPIVMQPYSFSMENKQSRPVYYSLEFPTTINLPPKARNLASKITDLIQIQHVLNKFQQEIITGDLHLENSGLSNLFQYVNYDFFHADTKHYENIRESKLIPIEDHCFFTKNTDNKTHFPDNSPFVRGCIRVSLKEKIITKKK